MHSIWQGAISFGLIHIPVRLYSASRSRELKFKLLHQKDRSEIRYARICKTEGKEIPWKEIAKGYEYKKGSYIVLTEEDFEKANVKKSKTIEVLDFTAEGQIETMYFEAPYYLEPEKGASKAYALLREALKKSKKVAVARFVFQHHEHLGVIKPHGDLLVLNQLRYSAEIIDPKPLNIPKKEHVSEKEVAIALKLIDELTRPFKIQHYSDTYTDELKSLIKRKARGKRVAIKKEKVEKAPKIHDMMSLLKDSLKQSKKRKPRAA